MPYTGFFRHGQSGRFLCASFSVKCLKRVGCWYVCLLLAPSLLPAQRYIVERLPEPVNSAYDEINPVISQDGQTLFFTRSGYPESERYLKSGGIDISGGLSPEAYAQLLRSIYSGIAGYDTGDPFTSSFNQDVWIGVLVNGIVTGAIHPGPPLNNAYPNTISSLTPDPDVFVVINQYPDTGGVQKGFSLIGRTPAGWSSPEPITIDDYYTLQPGLTMTMSSDGEVLVLSLEREDSQGDNDLYICFRTGEKHWSRPKNLGLQINSSWREITPHLSPDNRFLYFASNRPGGFGGMDIYYVERNDTSWTSWSAARRFVEPINSPSDESQPYFNPMTGLLFFSSRREGSSDIYQVRIAPPVPEAIELFYPAIADKKHRFPERTLRGEILNSKTREPVDASLTWSVLGVSGSKPASAQPADGVFDFPYQIGHHYSLTIKKNGFLTRELTIDPKQWQDSTLVILIDPIEVNTVIQLDNIYFERSKPIILTKSFRALDQLASILQEHGNLHISIEGHTDNVGPKDELQKLSEARAAAVKKYLTDRNISPARISTRGFGDTRPVSQVNSESGRQLNRRVEVRITKVVQ